jgi:hypothetical protein
MALDREPLVSANRATQFVDIQQARLVAKRYDPRAMTVGKPTYITSSQSELNQTLSAALSKIPLLRGNIALTDAGVILEGTVELPIPDSPLGRYLNLRSTLSPSQLGLEIADASVGDVPIPAILIRPTLTWVIDIIVGEGKGEEFLASVKAIEINGDNLTIALEPPATLAADLFAAARRVLNPSDAAVVAEYYSKLVEIAQLHKGRRSVSLADYLAPLFRLAQQRSQRGDPVEENTAAILALLICFGGRHFERVLGDVTPDDLESIETERKRVKLDGRHDWVQHFIVSAGLSVLGGKGFADLIGEAKEIKDADGPSGFSFTDLAADRAGVRFAQASLRSGDRARQIQHQLVSGASESTFFPPVADLPEGLSEAQFRARFGDIDTPRYMAIQDEIDRRIDAIALYQ